MLAEDFKKQVEHRLKVILKEEQVNAASDEARLMLSRISSLVLRGGKRFRPLLMLSTYEACGGDNPELLVNLGAALELFHQGLLIHDDLIDEDLTRHEGPNIVGFYEQDQQLSGTKLPQALGLLAGDLLLTLANKMIANDPNLTLIQKSKALSLLSQTMIGVIYGQQLDTLGVINKKPFSEKRLILIHSLKTALYTTQLPMHLSASMLDLSEPETKRIDAFGLPLGIYFQLVDDYSDYFSGQPKLRDYLQAKTTYPYYIGLKKASAAQAKFLKAHFGNKKLSEALKAKVVITLEGCGADQASRLFSDSYYDQAITGLNKLSLNQKGKDQLAQLLETIKI